MPRRTPMQAIRAKCLDCSGECRAEVRRCPIAECPLWLFRYGRNPNRSRGTANSTSVPRAAGKPAAISLLPG